MMTPLPSPPCGSLGLWSPKKNLNHGSSAGGFPAAALLVLMLTTAADAVLAAEAKPPAAPGLRGALPAGASITETPGVLPRSSHWGLSVATTKYAASRTVTV